VRDIVIADWNKFGAIVKAERVRLALSQHDVASRAGVSRSWLAKLEAGHRGAEFEQILRLLEALGLSLVLRSAATDLRTGDELSESPPSTSHVGPDAQAMQEVLDRRPHRADLRRNAWRAAKRRPTRSDHHG
jgi:transcriptional regulator with XRE-family HTH domain